MDQKTRQLTRELAIQQMNVLELLVQAIDTADGFQNELKNRNALLSRYGNELQDAQDHIQESEAVIAIRDGEIANLKKTLHELNEKNEKLDHLVDVTCHELQKISSQAGEDAHDHEPADK